MEKTTFTVFFFLLLTLLPKTSLSWWDQSWGFRKQVTVTDTSGNNLVNYPINITLDTASLILDQKMKEDCSDVRIVDEGTNSELPYSLINCNSLNTLITTRVNVTASGSNENIYVYYGNPLATLKYEPFNSVYYDLWDDFFGPTIDNEKWTVDCRPGTNTPPGWSCSDVYCQISSNSLDCFSAKDMKSGVYSNKNFSFYGSWAVDFAMKQTWENIYQISTFQNATDVVLVSDYNENWVSNKHTAIEVKGNFYRVSPLSFSKYLKNGTNIDFGFYAPLTGWHNFRIVLNYNKYIKVYYDGELKGTTDYSNFGPSDFKLLLFSAGLPGGHVYFDNVKIRKFTDPEPTVTIGEEQKQERISLTAHINRTIFVSEPFSVLATATSDSLPLLGLTKTNFHLSTDEPLPIDTFIDFNNGSYLLTSKIITTSLRTTNITLVLTYNTETISKDLQTTLLTEQKPKQLIITNKDWKNYIPAVSTRRPVLVHETTRNHIDYFIQEYNPDQIFQLGTNLSLQQESYTVDSPETLMKVFFTTTDIVTSSNKESAIASSMIGPPILINASHDILDYLKPKNTYLISSVEQAESFFPNIAPNHFVLVNPDDENSMFVSWISINKNAFIIIKKDNPENTNRFLREKIKKFYLPQTYLFDQTVFLTLLGVPSFDASGIKTDTPYADINDDGYLDLSLGRLQGTPEQLSFQIEYSNLLKPTKKALILASYNIPGKYGDVLFAGGTMPVAINIEAELMKNGFEVTRLVEKKSDFDELDETVWEEIMNMTNTLGELMGESYPSLIESLLGDVSKVFLIGKIGGSLIYAINEFDWKTSWLSLVGLNQAPQYPKHLPVLTEQSILEETPKNQLIIYLSKGNSTHWFIPESHTFWSTGYSVFDPDELSFNPSFHYLRYSNSSETSDKLASRGSMSIVSSSHTSHYPYADYMAREFFKHTDKPVGRALTEAKNQIHRLNEIYSNIPKTYRDEYYSENLFGLPDLSYDPDFDIFQSEAVLEENGKYILKFKLHPEYRIVSINDEKYLIFQNPDNFLTLPGKPITPLYTRKFILPYGSEVVDLRVSTVSKQYSDMNFSLSVTYPEEETEPFQGSFPDRSYWSTETTLLDGRKILTVLFSPAVYSSGSDYSARVFEEFDVTVEYTAPFEIMSVQAKNITKGEPTTITAEINNRLNQVKVNISAIIQTEAFADYMEKEFTLNPGNNILTFDYSNTNYVGNYSVSIGIRYGNLTAGPKYTNFHVYEPEKRVISSLYPSIRQFFLNATSFFKKTMNFLEIFEIRKEKDVLSVERISFNTSIHFEQKGQSITVVLKTKDAKLVVEQTPTRVKYTLTSPDGVLVKIKEGGTIQEAGEGNMQKLSLQLNQMIQVYDEEFDAISNKIS